MKKEFSNIIVTGGAGFIGNHLVKKLSLISKKIFVIDNYSTGFNFNFPRNTKVIRKNCNEKNVFKQLNKYKFDSIIHLAGVSSVEASFENPVNDAESNILSTLNLLKFVKKKKIKNFIFSSSMCVYGNLSNNVKENQKLNPISFYGRSKLAAEEYIKLYPTKGTTKVILRLFNVYGPGTDKNNKKHGMVGIFFNQAIKNKKILVKGSLSRFRDFIYVDDVTKIIINSMKLKDNKLHLFNVCSQKKTTVKTLLNKIISVLKLKRKITCKGKTPADQFGIYGNNYKIKKKFKIKKFIDLETGLKKMISLK